MRHAQQENMFSTSHCHHTWMKVYALVPQSMSGDMNVAVICLTVWLAITMSTINYSYNSEVGSALEFDQLA